MRILDGAHYAFVFWNLLFLQLLQLVHHTAQYIKTALPEFRRANINARISEDFGGRFRSASRKDLKIFRLE